MIEKLLQKIQQRRYTKLIKLTQKWYSNPEDRAFALMAEGAAVYDAMSFGSGNPMRTIIITPNPEGGYNIQTDHMYDEEDYV